MEKARILINIPDELKNEFQDNCKKLGLRMTDVIIGSIIKFNSEVKKQPKKQ